MSNKCRAYSESKLGLEPPDNRKAFYAGWDAALKAALAEPVQEPVAKVELMMTGGNAGLATRIVEIDDHLRERLRPGQMLYTRPAPQRQPLTDEQIMDLMRDMSIEMRWPSTPLDIARAIERAHGIGGQDGQK